MRADTVTFNRYNTAPQKSPRFVVAIIFDVGSLYITSHTGITTVPGIVLDGALRNPSALSQRIVPDEGRTEIGAMSFDLVDLDSSFTDEVRDKLDAGAGLRGKEVRLYVGYEGMDFTAFQRFCTQVVSDAEYDEGVYTVRCRDISREQRQQIFEPKTTTLRASIGATDTTVPVYSTSGFSRVFHGPSYSDSPSSTVGYLKIEDEIIRYTGIVPDDSFTGCTRGVLNTRAVAHEVDPSVTDRDRRPKVEEYIYLELPVAKLIYAILTGTIYNDSATLPSHWNLGIASTWVRLSDFTGIGADLWDPTLDTNGVVARFGGLKKTDGKKFLESELYQLLGCYPVIYSDGTIGVRKMNHVLTDASYVVELTERNCVSWSALKHDMDGMFNAVRVNWNWDGEDFTRASLYIDAASVSTYGQTTTKEFSFKGLHGSRHTDSIVRKRIDALRDRYTYPPETMQVTVLPSLNRLEVGDIVRVRLPTVRDFAGSGDYIDRSFEIQQKSEDFATGDVTLSLFGSTGRADVSAPTAATTALPDAYYTAQGVNLNTVCTISVVGGVGVIQPGTYNLTGNADMNNTGAVYYYPGDLTLADGAILQVNNNVQIRVRGFVTINGDIDGIGRGKAGVADSAGYGTIQAGTPGYIGNSRGMDGAQLAQSGRSSNLRTIACALTKGANDVFPRIELAVSGTSLLGIPGDLRGTSGGGGGKIQRSEIDGSSPEVRSVGGAGANSGAGLAIICRGLALGASGSINLSGASSAATSVTTFPNFYPGAGGAGSPGGFLLLLDGSGISLPDLGGRFIAACGSVPVNGTPLPQRGPLGPTELSATGWMPPGAGYMDESYISGVDLSNAAHRIQYVPETQTAVQDQTTLPPAPTSLSVTPSQYENVLIIGMPPAGTFDVVEVYAAITNDRTGAVLVDSVGGSAYRHQLGGGVTRYYWVRSRRGNVVSNWFPSSSTGGISAATYARYIARGNCQVIGDVAQKVGGSSAWDSDVYSPDRYLNGCFVTFRPDVSNAHLMIGLNSDPTTNQSYTSLDYAFQCASDGHIEIWESNVAVVSNAGSYTTSTVFTITYDGKLIKYFIGGALVRQVPVQNITLFMDSSFYQPGSRVAALQFGPLNAITPSPWVARGNCIAGVTTARKQGGASGTWDSDIYSIDSYPVCHVKFKTNQANLGLMVGLNTDPTTDQNYTSIDYAWFADSAGNLSIYESGSVVSGFNAYTTYTTATELAITYDGSNVRYYKDRILQRTVAVSSLTLYADASFRDAGAAVNSLHFGPGTSLEQAGTPEIEPNAATEVYETTAAGPVNIVTTYRGIFVSVGGYSSDCEIIVTSTGRYVMNISASAACELRAVIDIGGFATPGSGDLLASNPGNVTGNVKGSYSLESRFTLSAGTGGAYYMNFLPSFSAPANVGSSVDLYDIRHKVEVIKR